MGSADTWSYAIKLRNVELEYSKRRRITKEMTIQKFVGSA